MVLRWEPGEKAQDAMIRRPRPEMQRRTSQGAARQGQHWGRPTGKKSNHKASPYSCLISLPLSSAATPFTRKEVSFLHTSSTRRGDHTQSTGWFCRTQMGHKGKSKWSIWAILFVTRSSLSFHLLTKNKHVTKDSFQKGTIPPWLLLLLLHHHLHRSALTETICTS